MDMLEKIKETAAFIKAKVNDWSWRIGKPY